MARLRVNKTTKIIVVHILDDQAAGARVQRVLWVGADSWSAPHASRATRVQFTFHNRVFTIYLRQVRTDIFCNYCTNYSTIRHILN